LNLLPQVYPWREGLARVMSEKGANAERSRGVGE